MTDQRSHTTRPLLPSNRDKELTALFSGLNGYGPVLLFQLLMVSLLGGITLIALGLSLTNAWCVIAGLICLRLYAYIGTRAYELLNAILSG
mgnify:CR=1 FL=1